MTEQQPEHSSLGASSAERWMNCPGSVALLKMLELPDTDEPDYRREGTAAHEVVCACLKSGSDAWEMIGQKFYQDTECSEEMANAVQVYLDAVRPLSKPEGVTTYVEFRISSPLHKQFYGTVDFGVVSGEWLHVRDYKHGQGIVVEVEWNVQLMYYTYGILRLHPEVRRVSLGIGQPRGFHPQGPIRIWEVDADTIRDWAENTLKPVMDRTAIDDTLDAGPWCRFCPAKLVCPLMTSLFGAACTANPKVVVNLSNESMGRSYQYTAAVKHYLKALEEETFRRLNLGQAVPGTKLVHKKGNRVFKTEAVALFKAKFGAEALHPAELKSPAEMEKVSPEAKALVHEYAYTPATGLTVAMESDKRVAVKVQATSEVFGAAIEGEPV